MTSSGQDDTSPPPELQGLNPKDLLQAGLETIPPVTLPPQPVDSDATIPVARPQSTQPAAQVELPLPEELTKLLPGGNYHVESFLGQGGMGAVYKGMQVRLKRPVAIKIMRRDMGKDYDFEARFEREAQAMAKLNHPNIVSVIDFGEAGPDYLYIVMELIDGADLMDVIRGGQMTQEMALSLLPQVCDALQFAHDHGIVHRDIKPSNIMLTRDGRVKMCDFGLAKRYDVESSFRTQTGTGMGTPDYAAPEQFDPKANIDHRADIYALGVMIYQMITGQLPRGVWKRPSERAPISPQWDEIVSRAMQSDPSDRYQQASEVKTDVSSIPLAGKSDAGTPARKESTAVGRSARITSESPPLKSRAALIFGLLVGAVVIALGTFFAMSGKPNDSAMASDASQESTLGSIMPNATTLKLPGIPVLPEDGWKPLFTETEWKETEKYDASQREFKDGLMHLQGKGLRKPQPAADGAIRARIHMRDDTKLPGLVMRFDTQKRAYSLGLQSDKKAVTLNYVEGNSEGAKLATLRLPKQVQPGQTIILELRVQDDRLIALSDGQLVADLRDSRLKDPGEWGIGAVDAWFESVEVQTLNAPAVPPTASSPAATKPSSAPAWNDWIAEKRRAGAFSNHPQLRDEPTGLLVTAHPIAEILIGTTFRNGRLRVACFAPESGGEVPFFLRSQTEAGNTSRYQVSVSKKSGIKMSLFQVSSDGRMKWTDLKSWPVPNDFDWTREYMLEFTAMNDVLTVSFNGKEVGSVKDSKLPGAGRPGFSTLKGTRITKLEYQSLANTSASAVSPSPSPAVSKPSTQFPPVNWVDFTADFRSTSKSKLKTEGDWSEPTADVWHRLPAPSSSKDLAVRLKFANRAELHFRKTGKGDSERFYRMGLGGNVSRALIARSENKQEIDLVRNSIELATDNSEHEMIAAIRGDSLELWLDGTRVASAKDGMLKTGEVEFVMYTDNDAPFRTRKLEYAVLDPLPSPSTATATKDAPFINTLGMKFVPVPDTKVLFCIHETRRQDYAAYANEVSGVDASWKNQQKNGIPCGSENDHPVCGVGWEDAQKFCQWLSKKEGKTYRLPTDEEWSIAVGLGHEEKHGQGITPEMLNEVEQTVFPWQGNYPPTTEDKAGNYADETWHKNFPLQPWIKNYNDGYPTTAPVMTFKPNKLGICDMGGNVWEWVEDWYDAGQTAHTARGVPFDGDSRRYLLSSRRDNRPPGFRGDNLGFRCVLAPSSSTP